MPEKLVYNMEEVASVTGISVSTLRLWRKTGQGPAAFKLGRRVAYRSEAVRAWLDEQEALSGLGRDAAS